jgi:hypothetical protein
MQPIYRTSHGGSPQPPAAPPLQMDTTHVDIIFDTRPEDSAVCGEAPNLLVRCKPCWEKCSCSCYAFTCKFLLQVVCAARHPTSWCAAAAAAPALCAPGCLNCAAASERLSDALQRLVQTRRMPGIGLCLRGRQAARALLAGCPAPPRAPPPRHCLQANITLPDVNTSDLGLGARRLLEGWSCALPGVQVQAVHVVRPPPVRQCCLTTETGPHRPARTAAAAASPHLSNLHRLTALLELASPDSRPCLPAPSAVAPFANAGGPPFLDGPSYELSPDDNDVWGERV